MPRFSANLSTLFREYAPLDRCRAAAEAGFRAVEFQFPYDLDLGALAGAIGEFGHAVSVINVPAGDLMNGGEGTAAVPGREAEFRDGVALAAEYVTEIGARSVNVLAGCPSPERGREACRATLAGNLRHAADTLGRVGVRVVVEAINDIDRPGFLLPRVADVAELLEAVDHPNVAIEFDLYHVETIGDPIVETLERFRDLVGHVQFADVPGRHEPGTGRIDFAAAFAAIDASGYDGFVAAEYFPEGRTEDGLGWFKGPDS